MTPGREIKNVLYGLVARTAKAVASPKRLELIELLCQAPKTVETLAREAEITVNLASAHLKELRNTRLVETERQGKNVVYRLASPDIARFWVALRLLAEDRLFELQEAMRQLGEPDAAWRGEHRDTLLRKARRGEIVVLDVRPRSEFDELHLPFARSLPLSELRARLAELPRHKPIVAYCRGPFCLMSEEAVTLLAKRGFQVSRLADGVSEWLAAGLPLESGVR
ncbi:MAG: ArsR family transcriptional regulator [Betaproteobacteria bacterium]|nr:ArsR family transcriptional regulator [Betaproteobacteria bacterium]MDE2210857.1 ArsR family transcriptional regulator [Betaproteobacteria bacterium]MDE2361000.1 ArsR family transcriptional regulator [Betaproteobacteria bacterium]